MLVNVGKWERFAAEVGLSGGGGGFASDLCIDFVMYLARPATSERGAADLKASPLPPAPSWDMRDES